MSLFRCAVVAACVLSFATRGFSDEAAWRHIRVPGTWERQFEDLRDYDGVVWYRCYVRVPDRWVSAPRGLWVESVTITLEYVADAYEVYVNGRKVGEAGRFPPDFEAAPEGLQRFKVPPGVLQKGKYNTIAIRVYNHDGEGGFKGRAPILAGYHHEIPLEGEWEFLPADDPSAPRPALDQRPPKAAYDKARPAISLLRVPTRWMPGRKFEPAESLRRLKTAPGIIVEQLLTEPLIAQPLSICFDDRARLWVVQYRQYPYPAGLKMVSRDHYYRAVYDRVPRPAPFGPAGADIISIHEDTDGDGFFDRHRRFLTGLNLATAVTFGYGGIWVLNPPYLLFYRDEDADDVPDGPPVVHLMGFGLEDTHSVANSITWGPDGWLYGAHGSTVSSRIRVVRQPSRERWFETLEEAEETYIEGAAIWRYDPRTGRFEVFAEGGGNAFGLYIDAHGRVFSGYNGAQSRGFYYIQGGYYLKPAAGKYGPLSNPYTFGTLPWIKSHTVVPRFSHAFVIYESELMADRYAGKLVAVDPLHQRVLVARMEPDGANFQTWDEEILLDGQDDIGFRPVELVVGPDGAIYVADFHEEFIAHGQHFQGQIDKNSGRLYRLRPRDDAYRYPSSLRLASLPTGELIEYLKHPDVWYRRTALRLLADRQDRGVLETLYQWLRDSQGQLALEALWAMNLLGAFDEKLAMETLRHPNPYVRLWTVRLLGDPRKVHPKLGELLGQVARREPHPEVRAQLAATAKRLDAHTCMAIVRGLVEHDEDINDPFIPWLIYWAVESKVNGHLEDVMLFFREKQVWERVLVRDFVAEKVMRRLATEGRWSQLLACAELLRLAPDRKCAQRLLAGFEEAYRGRSLASLPEELTRALAEAGGGSLALRIRMGQDQAVAEAIRLLADAKLAAAHKAELAQVLGETQRAEAVPALLHLLRSATDPTLLKAVLTALQSLDRPEIAETVLQRYGAWPQDVKEAAQALLVSRSSWALRLLDAVQAEQVPQSDLAPDVVQRLLLLPSPELQARVRKLWPEADKVSPQQLQKSLNRVLAAASQPGGDPYRGRKIFLKSCGKCHRLFGEGGVVGPDLTTYERRDVQRLALQIVNPSLEIREGFEPYVILTTDGRILSGIIQDQDERVVVLRTAEGTIITLSRNEIEDIVRQPKSIMPEGLLDSLTDEEIRDLFSYLRQGQPIR